MSGLTAGIRERYKEGLTRLGAVLPRRAVQNLRISVNYVALGAWMRAHGFEVTERLPHRFRVFDRIREHVGEPLLYLEFGVFKGKSMRYWSSILADPESRLVGFDSFEGLPETFDERLRFTAGAFDVEGQVPEIDDPRVSFEKGWFEDTLPRFAVPEHRALVITLDADLYSSTILVLRTLADRIVPGTVLYFDDFSQVDHEPRAFADFIAESGKRFRLLCTERSLNRPAFICV
jgi:hypothetical protein